MTRATVIVLGIPVHRHGLRCVACTFDSFTGHFLPNFQPQCRGRIIAKKKVSDSLCSSCVGYLKRHKFDIRNDLGLVFY